MMQKIVRTPTVFWGIVGLLVVAIAAAGFFAYTNYAHYYFGQASNNAEQVKSVTHNEDTDQERAVPEGFTRYQNNAYAYAIDYPEELFVTATQADVPWHAITLKGIQLERGGSAFVSNYADIDAYSAADHPEDFFVMNATTYRTDTENITTDQFAQLFNFPQEGAENYQEEVTGANTNGMQYIATAAGQPSRVMIVFQNGAEFFVLQPAFVNGRPAVLEMFTSVAQSFFVVQN